MPVDRLYRKLEGLGRRGTGYPVLALGTLPSFQPDCKNWDFVRKCAIKQGV